MLTAREEESDKVLGLEIGADDYITKPFSMRELLARIKANIRRSKMDESTGAPTASGDRIVVGNLIIDLNRLEVQKNDKPVDLTQREFELLRFLASYLIRCSAERIDGKSVELRILRRYSDRRCDYTQAS